MTTISSHAIWFSDRRNVNPIALMVTTTALALFAPLAAGIIQSSISRSREALADASAVEYTKNPRGLRNTLFKISKGSELNCRKATAHLFISSPIALRGDGQMGVGQKMFSTHPPIKELIKRLYSYNL